MTIVKRFLFCTAASVVMLAGAHAADLPVKAGKIEYVKVCSLYGAGFYYIPGTDTCVRIGGAMNILTTFNGNPFDGPMWQGGPGGANSYNRNYFQTLNDFTSISIRARKLNMASCAPTPICCSTSYRAARTLQAASSRTTSCSSSSRVSLSARPSRCSTLNGPCRSRPFPPGSSPDRTT